MDTISLIGSLLYQWDTGRKVKIASPNCINVDEVHFTNDMQDALVVEPKSADNVYYAEIPNILLQDKRNIKVYVVMHTENGERTVCSRGLTVNSRQKPADYIYTETEVKSYEKLDQRIKALEETAALTAPQNLTDNEKVQTRANIDAVGGIATATVGQVIAVKAVDENGKPTEWECLDQDWGALQNKPFGDLPTGGDTLTWDGNTEGLEYTDLGTGGALMYYKVSDSVPTKTDFANGFIIGFSTGDNGFSDGETAQGYFSTDTFAVMYDSMFLILGEQVDLTGTGNYTTPGVYFRVNTGADCGDPRTLTIPGYTGFPVTKKIEEKYLPDRGPIYLYVDAENYLYATEDTSDASKRLTCDELERFIKSGRYMLLVFKEGALTGYMYPNSIYIDNGVGTVMTMAAANFYTAEYVAE